MNNSTSINFFLLLFCYIFAFYICGISVSILISFPLYLYAFFCKKYLSCIYEILNYTYFKNIFKIWSVLIVYAIVVPLFFLTFDFSFFKIVAIQAVHFVAAIPFMAWLRFKKITFEKVELYFILIFVMQTVIQVIVVNNSFLSEAILTFNRFEPEGAIGLGANIRGKALSAATTYHLTLAYGIAFILYVKCLYSKNVDVWNIVIGLLLFIGIFFAGRTGFVGCFIGLFGYILKSHYRVKVKLLFVLKSIVLFLVLVFILLTIIFVFFPSFYGLLNDSIFPYAFEFVYSLDSTGNLETRSTNELMEMWNRNFDYWEFLAGSGKYTNVDGTYYMHVDPGILRHSLFMGFWGYVILLVYQFFLLPIWSFKGEVKYYYSLILLFLCIMEFKSVNVGVNKFSFSISMLLSYSYLYLPHQNIDTRKA